VQFSEFYLFLIEANEAGPANGVTVNGEPDFLPDVGHHFLGRVVDLEDSVSLKYCTILPMLCALIVPTNTFFLHTCHTYLLFTISTDAFIPSQKCVHPNPLFGLVE
jgi:hypothetical protein